jgi:hypothetical protein
MSHEEDKFNHSRRLHKDQVAIDKQVKIAKEHGIPVKEPHKLHKHHVMDCGNPDCFMCANPRKVWGEKTMQERKFEQKERFSNDDND